MIVHFLPLEWVERAAFFQHTVVAYPVRIERRELTYRRIVPTRRRAA
jgi:hypothetical protein